MKKQFSHTKLITFPVSHSPAGGLMGKLHLDLRGKRADLLVDFCELQLTGQRELFVQDGRPWERGEGKYTPQRLRFTDAHIVEGEGLFFCLESLAREDPGRLINDVWAWRGTDGQNVYLIDLRRKDNDTLLIHASRCLVEARPEPVWETHIERDWCPALCSTERLIPDPKSLRRRFGGDPVAVELDGRTLQQRLFIGGLDTQTDQRPEVGAVLNLGGNPSLWAGKQEPNPADRRAQKGEGSKGMSMAELAEEADWVIAHLRSGQRVLVHCSAGMNRSSSVCCAVLIRLEGLSAEGALERVREHHPWARPDPRHWLALRWMAAHPKS